MLLSKDGESDSVTVVMFHSVIMTFISYEDIALLLMSFFLYIPHIKNLHPDFAIPSQKQEPTLANLKTEGSFHARFHRNGRATEIKSAVLLLKVFDNSCKG